MGLVALVAGLTLNIPVVGAYHMEFGTYGRTLSGDAFVAEIVEVAVPSQATALVLRSRGYRIRRFEVLKNGVDRDLFTPEKRDPALYHSLGGGRKLVLYAGRLSREKGLETLAGGTSPSGGAGRMRTW